MAIVAESTAHGRPGILKLPGVTETMQEVMFRLLLSMRSVTIRVLLQISSGRHYPKPCWAICTSATREYARSALANAGIDVPDAFVVAEDVKMGKPA